MIRVGLFPETFDVKVEILSPSLEALYNKLKVFLLLGLIQFEIS